MAKKYKNVRERNGKFYYRYSIKDAATGKRKQKETKGYDSPKEAEKEGIKIQSEIIRGSYIETKNITLADFSDYWLETYSTSGVKQRTVDIRASSLVTLKRRFGGLGMNEITPVRYQAELNKLKADNYSRSSIDGFHAIMKMIFRKAVELEVVKKDITSQVHLPNFSRTVEELELEEDIPNFMEKEELATFLKVATSEFEEIQYARLLFLAAYTGMRIGEICALKITDFDELNKKMSVTKTLYVKTKMSEYILNTPKNRGSIRKIDLGSKVVSVIKEQLAWRNSFKMEYRTWFHEEGNFLFVNEGKHMGYPLHPATIRKYMTNVLSAANLPTSLTPHSLRHTFTSLMSEAGVELQSIQRLLGHEDDHTTKRIYLHITKAKKRAAIEKLDALMDGVW